MHLPKPIPDASPEQRIVVVVGGFHAITGEGIASALRADPRIEVAAIVASEALLDRAISQHAPAVALAGESIDYAFLLALRSRTPTVRPLLAIGNPVRFYRTLLEGARVPHVLLDASPSVVREAVHKVARSEQPTGSPTLRIPSLTRRENEVLRYLTTDTAPAEIAAALGISPWTVQSHIKNICRKLGIKRRKELIGLDPSYEAPTPI